MLLAKIVASKIVDSHLSKVESIILYYIVTLDPIPHIDNVWSFLNIM